MDYMNCLNEVQRNKNEYFQSLKKVQKRVLDENYPKNLSWAVGTNLLTVAKSEFEEEEIEEIANSNRSDRDWLNALIEYAAWTEEDKYQERKKKAL